MASFLLKLFGLKSPHSRFPSAVDQTPAKENNTPQPTQRQPKVPGHDHIKEIPIQIAVDYRARSPSIDFGRSDVRSPLVNQTRTGLSGFLTYPEDIYGTLVLSLEYSPLSSPSPASVLSGYIYCEADDELGSCSLSSSPFPSSPSSVSVRSFESELEFDFSTNEPSSSSNDSTQGSAYGPDSEWCLGILELPCHIAQVEAPAKPKVSIPARLKVTVPPKLKVVAPLTAKFTVEDLERRLQDVQVRLLRTCQDERERDALLRCVVLGIYGEYSDEDTNEGNSDSEVRNEEEDCNTDEVHTEEEDHTYEDKNYEGYEDRRPLEIREKLDATSTEADPVPWVIHAPRPGRVPGFKYARGPESDLRSSVRL